MASPIIKIVNLGKSYRIQHETRAAYRSLREELVDWGTRPLRALGRALIGRPGRLPSVSREDFWALHEVSFDLNQGDVVGIIGANGAGKSTLLKILSRITEPTKGRVEIEGRVASLLEVGTGFHPELTGRENIFLNGAILGMSRAEIRKKFDEIVSFAEVERFLDTPVKRYSSGMYVRLAFAVAAHLEPEILVVDEVLAVGDAQFQRKCMGKMHDVSEKEGRTVLFVSHQMGTIRQLCTRGMLLRNGRVAALGPTEEVIQAYIESQLAGSAAGYQATHSAGNKDISVVGVRAVNADGHGTAYFLHSEPIRLRIVCRVNNSVPNAEVRIMVGDSRGRRVFTADAHLPTVESTNASLVEAEALIPEECLRPETYLVTAETLVHNRFYIDRASDCFSFIVQDGGSRYAGSETYDYGCIFSPCRWSFRDLGRPTDSADGSSPESAVASGHSASSALKG